MKGRRRKIFFYHLFQYNFLINKEILFFFFNEKIETFWLEIKFNKNVRKRDRKLFLKKA